MSSAEQAARVLKQLKSEDWRVLRAMEKALTSHESIPFEVIRSGSGLNDDEVRFRLTRLNKFGLVRRGIRGYVLVAAGLDAIALKAFVKKGFISGMGRSIGVGKESDVFEVVGDQGSLYAAKFFRIGRVSFRDTKRKREYTPPLYQHQWLIVNIGAAKREITALEKLWPIKVSVPEPIARERHAILMKKFSGERLSVLRSLEKPKEVLREILFNVRKAFVEGGVVNSDLSEYNVLHDGEKICIIDWPQAVNSSHPNSLKLLDRDVLNILRFFERRFDVRCPLEEAAFYVRGWRDNLTLY